MYFPSWAFFESFDFFLHIFPPYSLPNEIFYLPIFLYTYFYLFPTTSWFVHQPVYRHFDRSMGCPVFFVLFYSVFLGASPFAKIFGFISSNCVVRLLCGCLFVVLSPCWVPVCFTFFSNFSSYRSFFICLSCLILRLDSVCLFRIPLGIFVLLLSSLIHAYIN